MAHSDRAGSEVDLVVALATKPHPSQTRATSSPTTPSRHAAITPLLTHVGALLHAAGVVSACSAAGAVQVRKDRMTAFATVDLNKAAHERSIRETSCCSTRVGLAITGDIPNVSRGTYSSTTRVYGNHRRSPGSLGAAPLASFTAGSAGATFTFDLPAMSEQFVQAPHGHRRS